MNMKTNTFFSIIIIICIWFAAIAGYYSESANKLALYIVLPFALILSVFYNRIIRTNEYFKVLFLLVIWISVSFIWAGDKEIAFGELKQLLGVFILSYLFTTMAKRRECIPYLYISYIVLFISACVYAKNNIFETMISSNSRLDDEKLNANTLAYLLFYCTYAIYELKGLFSQRFMKMILDLLFIFTIPLTFITAILTASRQVFVIQMPLIIALLYFRYYMDVKYKTKVIFLSLVIFLVCLSLPYVTKVYEDSLLKVRNETSIKDDIRVKLFNDALKVGAENFPVGVGPGNYMLNSSFKLMSHNSYSELFANEGLIGVSLYLILLYLFISKQIRRYMIYKDKHYLVFLTFGIMYVVDGFFYVFYSQLWLFGAFMLVASHSETYYYTNSKSLDKVCYGANF